MRVARVEANRLAKRVAAADRDLAANSKQMTALLASSPAAGLLDQPGIGPVTAAVAFTAWSHPGRVRSEAAFASLAGVNPIPASSGNTVRHRINREGDRRLNRALHMAVVARVRMDPATRTYVQNRTAEGRTPREIRRCLKRYLARPIYRQLNAAAHPPSSAEAEQPATASHTQVTQWPSQTPAQLRPRLQQPHQLHRPLPA